MPDPLRPADPQPLRRKPLREQLQQFANDQLIDMAEKGFAEIDARKARMVKKLQDKGITGMEEIADTGAALLKALIARGVSKR
jgi:hypothetical protein